MSSVELRRAARFVLAAITLTAVLPLGSCGKDSKTSDPFADYVPDPEVYMAPVDPDRVEVIDGDLRAPVDQLLFRLAEGSGRADADAVAEAVGGEVVGQIPALAIYQLRLDTDDVPGLLAVWEEVAGMGGVLDAAPNVATTYLDEGSRPDYCFATDDNHLELEGDVRCPFSEIDYYPMVKVFDEIRDASSLSPVRIAVLDSGLEMDTGQFDDVPVLWLDVPGENPSDVVGHGTAVTSLIAADDQDGGINGIATRLLGPGKVQIVFGNAETLSEDVLNMYRAGVDAKADVVNMSWGFDFNSHTLEWQSVANLLLQPIKAAPDTLFVAAAGNDNLEVNLLHVPQGLSSLADNLVTVGGTALCQRDVRWKRSNYGNLVNLAAPAEKVPVINYFPELGHIDLNAASGPPLRVSGTSASAPIVAAVAGTLRSIDPDMPPATMVDYMKNWAFPGDPSIGGQQVLTSLPAMQALLDRGVPESVRDVIEFEDTNEWTNPGLAANLLCGGTTIHIANEGTFQFTPEEIAGFWNSQGFAITGTLENEDITLNLILGTPTFTLDDPYSMPEPNQVSYVRAEDAAGGAAIDGELTFTDCAVVERHFINESPLQVEFSAKFHGTFESVDYPESPDTRFDAFSGTFSLPVFMQAAAPAITAEELCTGGLGGSGVSVGELTYANLGCANCHDNAIPGFGGPSLAGIWGTQVALQGGGSVTVDEDYLRESILDPSAKIVAGYENMMPSFEGLVSEAELAALVDYIQGLE